MVDGSDDKTTTFPLLLFNFYHFPQAFLSITDLSLLLSVFFSVHLSFPPLSPLSPLFPWCLLSFHPALSWINNLFLISRRVFLNRSPFFFPYLFPSGSLVACCRSRLPVKPILFPSASIHLCPILPRSLLPAVSSSLSLLVSASPRFVSSPLASPLVWYSSRSSSHPREPAPVLFYLVSSSGWGELFCFRCSHLFLLECSGSHAERSLSHPSFKPLNFFFLSLCPLRRTVIEHWGKLDGEKEETCSRAEKEISQISLQQWEMVITADESRGIKFFLMALRRTHWESIAFIHLCLSLSPTLSRYFPFPPFFSSSLVVWQAVCLPVWSPPRNRIPKETKSSGNHSSGSIHHPLFNYKHCVYFLISLQVLWDLLPSLSLSFFFLFSISLVTETLRTSVLSLPAVCCCHFICGFSLMFVLITPFVRAITHRPGWHCTLSANHGYVTDAFPINTTKHITLTLHVYELSSVPVKGVVRTGRAWDHCLRWCFNAGCHLQDVGQFAVYSWVFLHKVWAISWQVCWWQKPKQNMNSNLVVFVL